MKRARRLTAIVHWNKFFDVVLIPNPMLSEEQQKVIAQDYSMANKRRYSPRAQRPSLLLS